jgi:hypothetical protein
VATAEPMPELAQEPAPEPIQESEQG